MRLSFGARITVLALSLAVSGCHFTRPGEYRPQTSAACDPQRVAYLEGRFEQASEAERRLLEYCRQAQASEALRATQEHVDYLADLNFVGIVLGLTATVVTILAEL